MISEKVTDGSDSSSDREDGLPIEKNKPRKAQFAQLEADGLETKLKISPNSLKGKGKLTSQDKSEYIKLRPDGYVGLPYSAKLLNGSAMVKLHSEAKLLTSADKYVARVEVSRLAELDNATSFDHAKELLEGNLTIVEELRNEVFKNVKDVRECLETRMEELGNNSMDNIENAEDLYQLGILLRKTKNKLHLDKEINGCYHISQQTRRAVANYMAEFNKINKREGIMSVWIIKSFLEFLGLANVPKFSDDLRKTIEKGLQNHKKISLEVSPKILQKSIDNLKGYDILFVTKEDLQFFSNLIITLNDKNFELFLPNLTSKYISAIENIKTDNLQNVLPITNHIYVYLCKSLTDIMNEISTRTETSIVARQHSSDWKLEGNIQWKSPPSLLEKCLERELELLLGMVNHFEPGKKTCRQHFTHVFTTFDNGNNDAADHQLPIDIHVWLCLLDDTISNVLLKDRQLIQLSSCLFNIYKNFSTSENSTTDSLESLRVITHNIIRFLALHESFSHSKSNMDKEILRNQIAVIRRATSERKSSSFLDCRDLVEVFTQYWKHRHEFADGIEKKLAGKLCRQHVVELEDTLLQLMNEALVKKVELAELTNFCRAYDELLADLLDLKFDWYIRPECGEAYEATMKKKMMELVLNKWQDNEHKCYRVTNVERFSDLYTALSDENDNVPRHYTLETTKLLVNCILNILKKVFWYEGKELLDTEQINSCILMICSVRSCLIYLDEQPEYISFDKFVEENSKPFEIVLNESTSFEDFKKRVLLVKESFWYIRNLNVIDINTALDMFELNNQSNFNREYLHLAYTKYCEQFERYMAQNGGMNTNEKIEKIIYDVREAVDELMTSDWDFEFKQEVLPEILAAIGAVWALHTSKDVATTGQYLKPHCIQVLGVLRLLGADSERHGVQKHLAQVLTGQGKSLILGMTACALAMCGHSVIIMCYSEYLASRDEMDFEDLYNFFQVRSQISYKTFKAAAIDDFHRVSGNAETYIHKCLGVAPKQAKTPTKLPNPVLLIDEVDVFFNDELFGKTLNLLATPIIPGLGKIQAEIWNLVMNDINISRCFEDILDFAKNSSCNEIKGFFNMLSRKEPYTLLEEHSKTLNEKETSNSQLFELHLKKMIRAAEKVMKMNKTELDKMYRLNEEENITMKGSFGIFNENYVNGYINTFAYFLLKKESFVPVKSNYGYLVLDLGSISYAKLPENYPLILGVTGTLTTLSDYEKKVVKEYYRISKESVMPSFFGKSNLSYDESKHLICLSTCSEWLNAIVSRINTIVNAKLSALVIFDTEERINTFKQQFAAQLDRLNVLTINTKREEKDRFINDAGVSKTITLATREMGRGVDYKSSVTVEKTGGVHVIQTFFSLDVKEETQIKGRTARKDNRGSYEMILCYEDLQSLQLVTSSLAPLDVTYKRLDDSRKLLNRKKDRSRDETVHLANEKHVQTVQFYTSC